MRRPSGPRTRVEAGAAEHEHERETDRAGHRARDEPRAPQGHGQDDPAAAACLAVELEVEGSPGNVEPGVELAAYETGLVRPGSS